jgi:hypothetical protein
MATEFVGSGPEGLFKTDFGGGVWFFGGGHGAGCVLNFM